MKNTYNLVKLFGIQFRLHYSWLFIFLLVVVYLAWAVFPPVVPEGSVFVYAVMGIVTSLLFFASVLLHELAHSLMARSQGTPIHGITLYIFGGAAQMTRDAKNASDEFKMAIVGPATSLLLAGLFGVVAGVAGNYVSFGDAHAVSLPLYYITYWLAFINVVLAIFNLLPGFPLDGGRLLRAAIWHFSGDYMKAMRYSTIAGRILGYLIIAGGLVYLVIEVNAVGWEGIISGLWMMFIGWFLADTAQASYRQAQLQQVLKGFNVSKVMKECPVVEGSTSVAEFKTRYAASGKHCFLVSEGKRVEGYFTSHNVGAVFPHEMEETNLKNISEKLDIKQAAEPGQDALSVVQQMFERGISEVPVMENGRVVGMVLLDDLIEYVNGQQVLVKLRHKK